MNFETRLCNWLNAKYKYTADMKLNMWWNDTTPRHTYYILKWLAHLYYMSMLFIS